MNKKKLLAINLNEFNLNFLKYGAIKYECINIEKLLNLKNIKTFSEDKVQDKNLDPWVQNISINSGKKSKKQKTFFRYGIIYQIKKLALQFGAR